MSVRYKLFLAFGIMLVTLIVVAAVSVWSIQSWRDAAGDLSSTREQSFLAERLRTAMTLKINLGIDYLDGEEITDADFETIESQIQNYLRQLETKAKSSQEIDHITGLVQTHNELTWVISGFRAEATTSSSDHISARRRLREIADEVTSDVAALNQFYRGKVNESVEAASAAGQSAIYTIAGAILLSLSQLIVMGATTQRWLVRPFRDVNLATASISEGNLDTRIAFNSKDEWSQLGKSINDMARSLKNLQQQLATKERFAALGELGAYTAHNIRNPLAGIRAAVQVLDQDIPENNAEARETIVEIINTVDRLNAWIKGFLEFARPMELNRTESNINNHVQNVLEIFRGQSLRNGTRFESNLSADLHPTVVDTVLVEQAIAVLVTNACESGGDAVVVSTFNSKNGDGNHFQTISVTDNGRGISEAMRAKLFKVFATDKPSGTGLGLAQAKKVIELHGGNITLADTSERGTTFQINLPLPNEDTSNNRGAAT